ncbi:hypothetical protein [Marivita sp.]|uniref:hypothetical protein n=1 Tax=Marivita sp. TaxID=2003365 RepID=UPI00321C3602
MIDKVMGRIGRGWNALLGASLRVCGVTGCALGVAGVVLMITVSQGLVHWPVEWLQWYRASAGLMAIWLSATLIVLSVLFVMSEDASRTRKLWGWSLVGVIGAGAAAAAPVAVNLGLYDSSAVRLVGNRAYVCGALALEARGGLVDRLGKAGRGGPWTLVLKDNDGGHVSAARKTAAKLEELGVEKVVAVGRCSSACALLWTLAPERALADHSVLGFHGPFDPGGVPDPEETQIQISDMVRTGFTEEFSRTAVSFNWKNMGFLSAESPELVHVKFERVARVPADATACE